ncbi:MAG: methionyl-tRNA formyltransferase [Nitrospirae bacterium]|nr:methionyl-tRNA formyltransferase [Nitrospirota bacterium]
MGTPEFAVPTLSALAAAGHEVTLVISQPDRPKGRGRKTVPPPVKVRAEVLGIPVYQPEKVKVQEAVVRITAERPDVIVVAAFGQILPKSILDIPPMGCLNVHAAILPKYRGAAPINWAIIRGETVTGVTIMKMDVGMDTGDMLLAGEEPIRPDDTAGALTGRLAALGAGLLIKALDELQAGRLAGVPQDPEGATYAPMLKKETGRVDWTKPAIEIERQVRGLDPWPGAYTSRVGETLKIWGARVADVSATGAPGEVIEAGPAGIRVLTGDGALLITEIQTDGGRRMDVRDYLAGHKVTAGERLG